MQSSAANISQIIATLCSFVLKHGVGWHDKMVQMQVHIPVVLSNLQLDLYSILCLFAYFFDH